MQSLALPLSSTPSASHAGVLMRRLGQPLLAGNRVDLLNDGPATFDAMFRAVEAARDHINIESYTVEDTGPGEELAQRLEARCREGIRVNLLFDSFGSLGTSAAFFERLLAGQLEQVLTEGRASAHSIEAQRWAQRSLRRRWQEAVARRFEVLM